MKSKIDMKEALPVRLIQDFVMFILLKGKFSIGVTDIPRKYPFFDTVSIQNCKYCSFRREVRYKNY